MTATVASAIATVTARTRTLLEIGSTEQKARKEQQMKYIMYKDTTGQWRWRLVAANGRIIANSGESYANKQDCIAAIALVKTSGNAPVQEQ
jgi:uncharacterized protein